MYIFKLYSEIEIANMPITPEISLMSFYSPSLIPNPQVTRDFPVTHLDMLFFHFYF